MSYNTTSVTNVSLTYDTRLRPTTYLAQSYTNEVQDSAYTYNNDSTVKEAINNNEANFSQSNDYDFAGRIKRNDFGTTQTGQPYKQTLGYDAFNNITSRNTKAWDFADRNFTAGYTNNRKSSGGYNSGTDTFDVAGNITQNYIYEGDDEFRKWKFDAAGRMTDWEETLVYNSGLRDEGAELVFDGDGRVAKRVNRHQVRYNGNSGWIYEPEYTIYSSVTGKQITTLTQTGGRYKTFVYMGGSVIAEQTGSGTNNSQVVFKQSDPVTESEMQTGVSGEITPFGGGRSDVGALGVSVPSQEPEEFPIPNYRKGGHIGNPESGCQVNYAPVNCNRFKSLLKSFGFDVMGGEGGFYISWWKSKSGRTPNSSALHEGNHNIGNNTSDESEVLKTSTDNTFGDGGIWVNIFVNISLNRQQNRPISFTRTYYALKACIDEKWKGKVQLNSFLRTQAKRNGKTNLTYVDGEGNTQTNTVVNNVNYNADVVTAVANAHNTNTWKTQPAPNQRVVGTSAPTGVVTIDGKDYGFSALENYTASNVTAFGPRFFPKFEAGVTSFVAVQIHELGNSIAHLTGISIVDPNNPDSSGDPDSGIILERCVANKLTGGK